MKSTPLKFHGGKSYFASLIVGLVPPDHVHFGETHFGSGAVTFAKPPLLVEGYSEFANDVNGELMNFWRMLQGQDTFAEMARILSVTPFSEIAFQKSKEASGLRDDMERAVDFFVFCRQSMAGRFKGFAPLTKRRVRRGMNEQASAWLSAIEGLPECRDRLIRIAIVSDDACRVIRREDGRGTFFYCDPPYLGITRVSKKAYGKFEYTPEQHQELLKTLSGIEGRFLLSGYNSDMYEAARKEFGWERLELSIDNKASSKKTKDKKIECLWANYPLETFVESLSKDHKAMILQHVRGERSLMRWGQAT